MKSQNENSNNDYRHVQRHKQLNRIRKEMDNMKEELNKEKNLSEIQKLKKNSQIKRTVDNLINRMDQ